MGELRSKAGAGGYSGHSGQKEWVKSMVDYLAAPPRVLRTFVICKVAAPPLLPRLKYLKAFVLSQCQRLST